MINIETIDCCIHSFKTNTFPLSEITGGQILQSFKLQSRFDAKGWLAIAKLKPLSLFILYQLKNTLYGCCAISRYNEDDMGWSLGLIPTYMGFLLSTINPVGS